MCKHCQHEARNPRKTIPVTNLEDYLMQMRSVTDLSARRQNNAEVRVQRESARKFNPVAERKNAPKPIVETQEKTISPGVIQYTTKIVQEAPGCGEKKVRTISRVLNKNTGTLLTVERNDIVSNCPVMNGTLPPHNNGEAIAYDDDVE